MRELSRGGRRKNDQIDAAAAATVACLQGDGRDVEPEDHTTALALLDERRVNLAQARVRTVNQLHALLRDLLPGGAPTQLSAGLAATLETGRFLLLPDGVDQRFHGRNTTAHRLTSIIGISHIHLAGLESGQVLRRRTATSPVMAHWPGHSHCSTTPRMPTLTCIRHPVSGPCGRSSAAGLLIDDSADQGT